MCKFSKKDRLLNKKQFDRVFIRAQKLSNPFFLLLYRANDVGHSRIGTIVSKKNVSKASKRNKVKRLVRESYRKGLFPAVDIVFLAKKGCCNLSNAEFFTKLDGLWEKLKKQCKQ